MDFDLLWKGLGYNQKSDAFIRFNQCGFVETLDWQGFQENSGKLGGRPSKKIMLTVDAAKSFCMMANTETGKQVRLYFIECERQLKEIVQSPAKSMSQMDAMEIANEALTKVLRLYRSNQPGLIERFESAVDELALPTAKKTTKELVEEAGLQLSPGEHSALGRHLAACFRDVYHVEPDETWEENRYVKCYPADMQLAVGSWAKCKGLTN